MKNGFPLSKWQVACFCRATQTVHSVPDVSSLSAVSCSPGRAAVKPQKSRLERGAPKGLWSAQKWNRTTAGPVLLYIILSDNQKVKGGQYMTKF